MIWLDTKPHVQAIDPKTEVQSIEYVAIVEQLALALRFGGFKVGDEFEWEAKLSGKVTLTERHIEAAKLKLIE